MAEQTDAKNLAAAGEKSAATPAQQNTGNVEVKDVSGQVTQNQANATAKSTANPADGSVASQDPVLRTASDRPAVSAEQARRDAEANRDPNRTRVNDTTSPEAMKRHNEQIDKENEERNKRNEAGHAKNMEADEKHAERTKDGQLPPGMGKARDQNTPDVLEDGSKIWRA